MSFINTIREDIKTVQALDPAAQNGLVIFLSYPGLHAKWNHVPEHWLWEHGHRSLARVLSQITRHRNCKWIFYTPTTESSSA